MTRTVDVIIVGGSLAAIAATVDAVRRGQRVLVVTRSRHPGLGRSLRQAIGLAGAPPPHQLTVLTGAEVACVDGVNAIEAVVVRQLKTRRLVGFNASALLDFGMRVPKARASR